MTYAAFLVQFVLLPIGLLALLVWRDRRRGVRLPPSLCSTPAWAAVLLHVMIAVAYTTPWDNYLIVTGVWRYDPNLVAGIFVGWVPIEEYCFFVLQPILIGLWIVWIAPRLRPSLSLKPSSTVRAAAVVALLPAWLLSAAQLAIGAAPQPTYLSLILVWALPPVMLQLGFGADILLRHRALVLNRHRRTDCVSHYCRRASHQRRHLDHQSPDLAGADGLAFTPPGGSGLLLDDHCAHAPRRTTGRTALLYSPGSRRHTAVDEHLGSRHRAPPPPC